MVRIDRRIVTVLRIAVGALFVAAALPKLQDPAAFANNISHYHLVIQPAERFLALALPPLELIVGLSLIFGVFHAGASFLAFALLLVFTTAIGIAVGRDLDISCGCFGKEGGTKVGAKKLAENAAFIAAAFVVWRGDRTWLAMLPGRKPAGE